MMKIQLIPSTIFFVDIPKQIDSNMVKAYKKLLNQDYLGNPVVNIFHLDPAKHRGSAVPYKDP